MNVSLKRILEQLGYPEIKSREHNLIVLNMLMALTDYGLDVAYVNLSDEDKKGIEHLIEQIGEVEDLDVAALRDQWHWSNL